MNSVELCNEIESLVKSGVWKVFYNDSYSLRMKHKNMDETFCPIAAVSFSLTGIKKYCSGGAIYAVAEQITISRRVAETFIRAVDFLDNCCWNVTGTEIQIHIRISNLIYEAQ